MLGGQGGTTADNSTGYGGYKVGYGDDDDNDVDDASYDDEDADVVVH